MSKVLFRNTKTVEESYNTKLILYSDGTIRKREYKRDVYRIAEGWEPLSRKNTGRMRADKQKTIRRDSLSRTRNMLYEYVKENPGWKTFITLTFADPVQDLTQANKKFHNYIRSVQRKYSQLRYIGVPEFQKNGRVHYHILTNIPAGSDLIPKRDEPLRLWNPLEKKYTVLDYTDLAYWKHGFSSAYDLEQADCNFRPELYMLKYLYKDLDKRLTGSTKILKSNNLTKPLEVLYDRNSGPAEPLEDTLRKYEFERKEIHPQREFALPFTDVSFKGTEVPSAYIEIVTQIPSDVYTKN